MRLCQIERLDGRVLLAATLQGSMLVIDGTDGDDSIVVAAHKRFINIAVVGVNDELSYFSLAEIAQISISGGAGNDRILVDGSLDALNWRAYVDGGAGNDRISTTAADDTIIGGEGHDKIYGTGGADSIDAGSGNDTVFAGGGNDTILGGAGSDRLYGEDGNDAINSGKGNDIVYSGDGNDAIKSVAGMDTVFGEAGNDSVRMLGGGIAYGGGGSDTLVALATALLYGSAGNDYLQGTHCFGEAGDDTLIGSDAADTLNGGDDNDLLRGLGGDDLLAGGAGDDALFGGGGSDTIYGGEGNDNLYGTDGYHDSAKAQAGQDDGFGEGGSDWFETDYRWNRGDYRRGEDRAVNSQNSLSQDPSAGLYTSGTLTIANNASKTGAGSLTVSGSGIRTVQTNATLDGRLDADNYFQNVVPTIETFSLGGVGWLSSGAYDTATEQFVPPPMTRQQRLGTARAIMQVPANWNIGEASFARDEIVWYQVWRDGAIPPVPRLSDLRTGRLIVEASQVIVHTAKQVSSAGLTLTLMPGTYNVVDGVLVPATANTSMTEPTYTVPTLTGTASVSQSTPHLYDGVNNGKYRYLGVKRGTVLISGDGSAVTDVAHWSLDQTLLALPVKDVEYRLAGYANVYRPKVEFDAVPTGGPKAWRGILLDGGAIWLVGDGGEPYFSSGR